MGWKINCLARRVEPGDDLEGLVQSLGFVVPAAETVRLDRGLYPSPGLALGHHNGHLILLSDSLVEKLLSSPHPGPEARRILELLGPHRWLIGTLHSVTNLYGFALYQSRRLLRGRLGSADDGLIWEEGAPFEWERWDDEEFDGEQAVFVFLSEVFGRPLDLLEDDVFSLELKRYRAPEGRGLGARLRRLFGF